MGHDVYVYSNNPLAPTTLRFFARGGANEVSSCGARAGGGIEGRGIEGGGVGFGTCG